MALVEKYNSPVPFTPFTEEESSLYAFLKTEGISELDAMNVASFYFFRNKKFTKDVLATRKSYNKDIVKLVLKWESEFNYKLPKIQIIVQ